MKNFIEYIETSCADLKDNHIAYLYKKKILDEMTDRANEITHAGLKDEKVLADLIADEYPDLKGNFAKFEKEEKKRRLSKLLKVVFPIGGLICLILIFVAYFSISNTTGAWDKTWLIIVGGIFAMIIFYTSFGIKKLCHMRRIFHPIARVLIVGCVMLFTVFMFLFWLIMIPELVFWPILPGGIALALVCDLVFAFATRQKFRTISLFVYMPIMATMLYIILAAYNVISWLTGWPIILLGHVADLIFILSIVVGNMKYFMYKQEVED